MKISESEIPYEELEGFGLTQEMVDDFPEAIMDKFLSGQRTPLLPIERADGEGVIHKDYARVRLVRTDGECHPVFLPLKKKNGLEDFSEAQREALGNGEVLKMVLPKNSSLNYVQLDAETNSIISVKSDIIDQNLSILVGRLEADDYLPQLQDGKPVSVIRDGQEITAGVDLNEETGIRTVDGSMLKWMEGKKNDANLDKYNFGIYGCWTLGENGLLTYVPEEDYTDEMVNAQDAVVENAKNGKGMGMGL